LIITQQKTGDGYLFLEVNMFLFIVIFLLIVLVMYACTHINENGNAKGSGEKTSPPTSPQVQTKVVDQASIDTVIFLVSSTIKIINQSFKDKSMQSKGLKPGGYLKCSAGETEERSDASMSFHAMVRCKMDFDFERVLGAADAERFLNLARLEATSATDPEMDGYFTIDWSTRFPKTISNVPLGTGRAAYSQLKDAITAAFPNRQFKTDSDLFIGQVFNGMLELDID
jgi:hypothetical protein